MVRRIAWVFAFFGTLILAAATGLLLVGDARVRVPAIFAIVTFSAVVLSHLGGIAWGLALREESGNEATRSVALGLSAVPTLAAWGILWLPTAQYQLAGALALTVLVWLSDLWLARHGLLPAWFVDLRTAITALVAVILGIALYLL